MAHPPAGACQGASCELFQDVLDLDEEGYLKVDAPSTRTTIPGVFAAGDAVDHTYR